MLGDRALDRGGPDADGAATMTPSPPSEPPADGSAPVAGAHGHAPEHGHRHDHHLEGHPHAEEAVEAVHATEATVTGLAPQGGAMDSVISVALFLLVRRALGLPAAIVASTGWSLAATVRRRRKGLPIGKLLPLTTAFLVVRGVIGIVTDSEAVYFGIGISAKAAIGVVLIGSVLARRALLTVYVPRVLPFPPAVTSHRIYRSTFNQLTVLVGLYELASAAWDVWLYNNSSIDGFVLIRLGTGWLSAFIGIFVAVIYADWRLRKIDGFDGLLPMLESMSTPGGRPAPARD